jgi:cell division protein FtsQ
MQSEFWSNQFEHAVVGQYGEIILIPRVGSQRIICGMYSDYQDQLKRVKSFYDHIIERGDLNRYASIDARFRGQVVGIKN